MKQSDAIKTLINLGNKRIEVEEREIEKQKSIKQQKIWGSWADLLVKLSMGVRILPHELLSALCLTNVDKRDMAPDHLNKMQGKATLMIDGLAPIYLQFSSNDEFDHYLVPAVSTVNGLEWFDGNNMNYWLEGTKVVETKESAYALAVAERNYKVYQEYKTKQENIKSHEVLKTKEPVYVPVTENTADAQAMSAIRAIIREEIHRLAYAD